MRLNEHQAVLTPKILLVPYSEHHVPTYHEWMQDEELQKATASEPLTLPEEYAMQKSWRNDADKLTFIVCLAPKDIVEADELSRTNLKSEKLELKLGSHDGPDAMIGDINLFLYPDEDEDARSEVQDVIGEVEIMIARKPFQGKGIGQTVLLTFLWYILSTLDEIMKEYHASHGGNKARSSLTYLRVKIDAENARSIKLFENGGFVKVHEKPNYFGELELRRPISMGQVKDIEGTLGILPLIIEYP